MTPLARQIAMIVRVHLGTFAANRDYAKLLIGNGLSGRSPALVVASVIGDRRWRGVCGRLVRACVSARINRDRLRLLGSRMPMACLSRCTLGVGASGEKATNGECGHAGRSANETPACARARRLRKGDRKLSWVASASTAWIAPRRATAGSAKRPENIGDARAQRGKLLGIFNVVVALPRSNPER